MPLQCFICMYSFMFKHYSRFYYYNFHPFCLLILVWMYAKNEWSLCAKLKIRKSSLLLFFLISPLDSKHHFELTGSWFTCCFLLLFECCNDRCNETWAEEKVGMFRKRNWICNWKCNWNMQLCVIQFKIYVAYYVSTSLGNP